MASIFTFDPDPPRVSSPWATPPIGDPARSPTPQQHAHPSPVNHATAPNCMGLAGSLDTPAIDYTNITRLEAEPQEGPTEYKLHLLLRRRRSFIRASTARRGVGTLRRSDNSSPASVGPSVSESSLLASTPPPLASTQSRQHRIEQLTTQLLWRLQQSCSYHISSTAAPALPLLPDDARLSAPKMPQRLLPGLEESKGALYEIGVADNGTIVGLAEDEMDESLDNLRAMAASLGCGVEVLRMLPVGECEWVENSGTPEERAQSSKLLVAEALVRPLQHLVDHSKNARGHPHPATGGKTATNDESRRAVEQLRVSVTGPTMSGKSSLLGTLSTATLDNGRGKSRLSLLKHRHEIASGMTSSVTQELIGYRDVIVNDRSSEIVSHVISYGSGDVSSWIDIHAAVESADNGRLVFLSDSAGHPRFHRTTVRGIVGWQPHWTLLCIPADDTDEATGKVGASPSPQELLGPSAADIDLSQAHLQLCLSLELPLVIAITKYDLATKGGLRQTLSKLLSILKEAGRKPCIIHDSTTSAAEAELHTVSTIDLQEAGAIVETLADSPLSAVPIILTSAVKGTGINKLHSFLRQLPLLVLPKKDAGPSSPSQLFYIEDVYSVQGRTSSDRSAIIGGYLRHGTLNVGDELVLGPYPVDANPDDSDSGSSRPSQTTAIPQSRSFPGALSPTHATCADRHGEWRRVRTSSLRNLRLPVGTLHADQVGTMAIIPIDIYPILSPSINRIRKGMVLLNRCHPKASKIITVHFEGSQTQRVHRLSIGSTVVLYVASVRASCKVISVSEESGNVEEEANSNQEEDEEDGFGFGFDDAEEEDIKLGRFAPASAVVKLQFIASREFVEVGAKTLVMPGGGTGLLGGSERGTKGLAGLEGFVGKVIEQHY